MGFDLDENATRYRLKFEDPALAGIAVTVAEMSVDEFLELTTLADLADPDKPGSEREDTENLLEKFAGSLVEWNLTRKGKPVPADRVGVGTVPFSLTFKMIKGWIQAQSEPDPNLPSGSSSGETTLEESLGLASSSQSPES